MVVEPNLAHPTTSKNPNRAIASKQPAMASTQTATHSTLATPTSQVTSQKLPDGTDGKTPHKWPTLEKTKLLELIIDQTSAGLETNNGNLKKEGWKAIMNGINQYFNIHLTCYQIFQGLYFDYKFVCNQL
ncbi:hypothetical protein VP01_760g8 [Puccinia sorghi]|uniref:Myb/SANT-like domain-containing protein n=1 Tax=Puccinia sorghi TaxID=27349 RepID=A0A0L6UE01_9BASI|nr:hypothetical protein VP01_760g8 [Puccinia sorghi]